MIDFFVIIHIQDNSAKNLSNTMHLRQRKTSVAFLRMLNCALNTTHRLLACVVLIASFFIHPSCYGFQFNPSSPSVKAPTVADGALKDCAILNLDRYVAVGDRGLILMTSNGGRNWESRSPRIAETLHAVKFKDASVGLAVGGGVEPIVGRSYSVIFKTTDAGNTWERISTRLPRLIGLERGPAGQWIAWGDWSAEYQASVFESFDAGATWAPILVPTGHMQAVGVAPATAVPGVKPTIQAIFVDRVGKVFATSDWIRFERLPLPTTPYQSYHFCKWVEGTWWIGGDAGALYRSSDGRNWENSFVPGSIADRDLITFTDIAGSGSNRWLVGMPGSVVWHSSDQGSTWKTTPTGVRLGLTSLAAGSESLVITCGEGGQVLVSRNSGVAWSATHESVSKVAVLNIASTIKHVGWDLLSYVQKESKRATAAVVVHDQATVERSGSVVDGMTKFAAAGARAGLISSHAWRLLPVSDSLAGSRATDLYYYDSLGTLHEPPTSLMVRRLVQAIRMYRPDVIVTDCPESYEPLQGKLAEAVQLAIAWSNQPDCSLYSPESGIPDDHWKAERGIYRGTTPGGLYYPKSMLLKSSSLVMGEVLAPIVNTATPYQTESFLPDNARVYYRTMTGRSTTFREPLDGLQPGAGSELTERSLVHHRTSTILKTSGWFEPASFLTANNFNTLVRDRSWEERLVATMKGIEPDSKGAVLYEIGIKSRIAGNWNQWASAMELLISEAEGTFYEEAALLELMRYTGSTEVAKVISNAIAEDDRKSSAESTTSLAVASSPFARPSDASAVQQASFTHAPRRIPIAVSEGLPEYHRLLAKLSAQDDWKRKEHRYAWNIASRYRSILATRAVEGVAIGEYEKLWPLQTQSLAEWSSIYQQEWQVARGINQAIASSDAATAIMAQESNAINAEDVNAEDVNASGAKRSIPPQKPLASQVSIVSSRPFLDGKRSDECWPAEPQLMLRDPWGADAGITSIYLAHDEEFLYIYAEALGSTSEVLNVQDRQRDSLSREQEQIRIRLDLDRDYGTWFEFGWSKTGQTADQLNDIASWNPRWFLATASLPDGWGAEIAIPKSELLSPDSHLPSRKLLGGDVWAISAIHMQPLKGTRSPAPAISDRFQQDAWSLFDFALPLKPTIQTANLISVP